MRRAQDRTSLSSDDFRALLLSSARVLDQPPPHARPRAIAAVPAMSRRRSFLESLSLGLTSLSFAAALALGFVIGPSPSTGPAGTSDLGGAGGVAARARAAAVGASRAQSEKVRWTFSDPSSAVGADGCGMN